MNFVHETLNFIMRPFESALFLPPLLALLAAMAGRGASGKARLIASLSFSLLFHCAYTGFAALSPDVSKWLFRLESPFVGALSVLVFPAALLNEGRARRLFMAVPFAFIALAPLELVWQYSKAPAGAFAWLPMRPLFFAGAFVGCLVVAGRLLPIDRFRKLVRVSALLALLFGGFALRDGWGAYKAAVERRPKATADMMAISETVPVLVDPDRLSYLPSAPCRFSADGGYVQGCNMELAQRAMQMDFAKAQAGDPGETAVAAKILAAALSLVAMCFISGRWFCGWICPLATLGDVFDFGRRLLGLPHIKPSRTVKVSHLVAGAATGAFGLLLARAYANIDANGNFLGCKIPLYPFCKICPGQQLCPLASRGPSALAPLPGTEWLFGFFRYGILVLLAVFLFGFLTSRRLWCRFCPMGMLGGLFNGGAMASLRKESLKCNGCGACNEVCPMDIHSVQREMVRKDVSCYDCLLCLKCVAACPQDGCISFELAGHKICESKFKAD